MDRRADRQVKVSESNKEVEVAENIQRDCTEIMMILKCGISG
jgi:hypothetical protein